MKITITDDHLKLLKHACISWDERAFGAPGLDCKRPYGNSDVIDDMHRILYSGRDLNEPTDDTKLYYREIHAELEYVIRIVFQHRSFEKATYVLDGLDDWVKVAETETDKNLRQLKIDMRSQVRAVSASSQPYKKVDPDDASIEAMLEPEGGTWDDILREVETSISLDGEGELAILELLKQIVTKLKERVN